MNKYCTEQVCINHNVITAVNVIITINVIKVTINVLIML